MKKKAPVKLPLKDGKFQNGGSYQFRRLSPRTVMTDKDPQPIQKIYQIIEFSEVSHSKGENILPNPLSRKFDPLLWRLSSDFK